MPPVFNVSLPRSGTRSMGRALKILGYEIAFNDHGMWSELFAGRLPFSRPISAAIHFGYFWIREIAEAYPEAIFLYYQRPLDDWLRSSAAATKIPAGDRLDFRVYLPRLATFGLAAYREDRWRETYHRQNAYVELCKRDGLRVYSIDHAWEPLCTALGEPLPAVDYPIVKGDEKL